MLRAVLVRNVVDRYSAVSYALFTTTIGLRFDGRSTVVRRRLAVKYGRRMASNETSILIAAQRTLAINLVTVYRLYITLFHQLNGSIKIRKKSTLINITQQKKERKEEKKQDLMLMFGYQPT